MKLATYATEGRVIVGVLEGDRLVSLENEFDTMLDLIRGGEAALDSVRARLADPHVVHALGDVVLRAPIERPARNVFALGLAYESHYQEGLKVVPTLERPEYPPMFTKSANSLCGPYDDIAVDEVRVSAHHDWEVELAVVIGRGGRHIAAEHALDHVHSYSVINDLSIRDIQRRSPKWPFLAKSLDRGSPFGPFLVTSDEFPDPGVFELSLRVNGVEKQRDVVRNMMFDIPTVIANLTQVLALEPGDIIATGTPAGVGSARDPREFLHPGDVMETEVAQIGVMRNRIVAADGDGES